MYLYIKSWVAVGVINIEKFYIYIFIKIVLRYEGVLIVFRLDKDENSKN